jgi:hypothetical protein
VTVRPYRAARALCALALFAALLGSTAPSPLYPIYVARWGIAQGTAAAIFAAYAVGTLATLVLMNRFGGRVADRRRILVPAALVVAAGGVGTGAITGAATAAMAELDRPDRRHHAAVAATLAFTGGAATGPILSSAAIALDLAPTRAPLAAIAALALLAAAGLSRAPWPAATRRARDLEDPEPLPADDPPAAVAPAAPPRGPSFALAQLAIAVSWTFGSALMAMGASLATDLFGLRSAAVAGLVPAAFQAFGGLAQFAFGRTTPLRAILFGAVAAALAQTVLVVGAELAIRPVLFLVMPVCGLAYGAAFVGGAALVNRIATPASRTADVSRFYIVGYLCNAGPTLALGALVDALGLRVSFAAFSAVVVALAALTATLALRLARRTA